MADHLQTPQPGYSVAYDAQEQQQHQQQQIPQGMGQSYQMTSIPGGTTTFQHLINHFWAQQYHQIEQGNVDFKTHNLPLARIKKVMKTDEDVRMRMMISAEAPMLLSKACELFILELTMRSWMHTEENKRRTLQRADIAGAITKTDTFDFLIDIVPRDEMRLGTRKADNVPATDYNQYYQHLMSQYPALAEANVVALQQQMQMQQQMIQQNQGEQGTEANATQKIQQ